MQNIQEAQKSGLTGRIQSSIALGLAVIQDRFQGVIESYQEIPLEELMFILYDGKVPQMSRESRDPFYCRKSHAQDEWCLKIADFQEILPQGMEQLIERIYDNRKTEYWNNDDDASFYAYEGVYQGRRLRVIFYNSANWKNREKYSFKKIKSENQPIRICWY